MQVTDHATACPISIAGGGRWARIIAQTLDRVVSDAARPLILQTPNSHEALAVWVDTQAFRRPVQVCAAFPSLTGPLIVANAASHHFQTVKQAIGAGRTILVEKPMVQTLADLEMLKTSAAAAGCALAPAHVFAFAPYVTRFAACVPSRVDRAHFTWTDAFPKDPNVKQYDPALPVYADWVPHIVSVLDHVQPGKDIRITGLEMSKGGARLQITGQWGEAALTLVLDRRAPQRQRVLHMTAQGGEPHRLDFSQEPGQIYHGDRCQTGGPDWGTGPGPLAAMLSAFVTLADTGVRDPRLQMATATKGVQAVEACQKLYQAAQHSWLQATLPNACDPHDTDLHYAFSEILGTGRITAAVSQRMIEIYQGVVDRNWIDAAYADSQLQRARRPYD